LIKLDRTARLSTYLVQDKIKGIFQEFFNPSTLGLGYTVDIVELTSLIKNINGVKTIYTQRLDTGDIIEGVSLAVWNPSYPNNDSTSTTKNLTLQDFQALYFYDIDSLASRIIVEADVSQETSVVNL